MNQTLKDRHMIKITDDDAIAMYNNLCLACENREGGMTDADQMIVADICHLEQTKQMLLLDIEKRGVGEERYNGRQKYYQENKSVAQARSHMEQIRRHMDTLKLTVTGRKAAAANYDDEFEGY